MMLESALPFWIFTFLKVICAFSLEMVGSSLHSRISGIYNYVPWQRCLLIQRHEKSMGPLNMDTHVFLDSGKVLSIFRLFLHLWAFQIDLCSFSFSLYSVSFFSLFCVLGDFLVTVSQAVFEFNTLSILFLIPKNVFLFAVVPFLTVLILFYGCNIFFCILKDSGWRFFSLLFLKFFSDM